MVTVRTSVECRAPVDDVVAVISDPDAVPQWTAGLERLEVVSGTPGQPGCVGRAHYRGSFGRSTVLTDVLEAVDPGRYYRSRIEGDGVSAIVETRLESIPSGTRISLTWTGTGSHLVANVTMRILRRNLERRAIADLRALARLAEDCVRGS